MNRSTNPPSVSSSDLIDAKLEEHQLCRSKQCSNCGYKLEEKLDWVGLPAGVKFDPTDQELIEHLEAKVEDRLSKSHPLIDEFIPTIQGEDGICYTHPEKLPGVTRDGLNRHFFHRPSKAYTTGTRKRRKIQTECDLQGGETRWHKTGKTRPVMVNGRQKGCKKILVLYTNFGKNRKPEKTNWVMHQYHLGQNEEEKEGELVVSKIFYQTQPRQCNWGDRNAAIGEPSGENPSRRDSGSGSCSSREVIPQRDETCGAAMAAGAMSGYGAIDIQQLKADQFSFSSFRKGFDEVGIGEGSAAREAQARGTRGGLQEHRGVYETLHEQRQHAPQQHHHAQDHNAAAAFHMSTASHPISTIIPPSPLHHASIILNDNEEFHVPRIMLQNESFQQPQHQDQQQQHHHKLGGRSGSGLEELIMGCTSTDHIKDNESTISNPQEPEWLKYSSFWPDPDNPDHHHG